MAAQWRKYAESLQQEMGLLRQQLSILEERSEKTRELEALHQRRTVELNSLKLSLEVVR